MTTQHLIPVKYLLNSPITSLPFDEQIFLILRWARMRESRTVYLANVHMLMESYWHEDFARVLKSADLVAPDGMPLVWMLKKMGAHNQNRVAGMDVFLRLCDLASSSKIGIFFLGSQGEVLKQMKKRLETEFPNLQIAGMEPLPFGPLTPAEDEALIDKINSSGTGIVFVCLGCPKQEYWIIEHRNKIQAVMLGIGAVFPLYAGLHSRAPSLMRDSGLEWLYRLIQEPHRLWKRYSQTIPPFIWLSAQQLDRQGKSHFMKKLTNFIFNKQYSQDVNLDCPIEDLQPLKIGEILVRQNLVSETSLSMALEKQYLQNKKLGEILVAQQDISPAELEYHLKNQKIKLGELLVQHKIVSQSQLNQWLEMQKSTSKKLGEIIVEKKILSHKQIKQFLIEQYCRRQGLWLIPSNQFAATFQEQETFCSAKNLQVIS
jgi:N-acetylglucosaminyldiphosphoundecaprenol N-acetyl-beta-D-mannosaminyltransferase